MMESWVTALIIIIIIGIPSIILIYAFIKKREEEEDRAEGIFTPAEATTEPLSSQAPTDIFNYGFGPMWGANVRHMMKIYAASLIAPILVWMVLYLYSLYLLTVNILWFGICLGASTLLVVLVTYAIRAKMRNWGDDMIRPLQLVDFRIYNMMGTKYELARFHLSYVNQLSEENFKYAIAQVSDWEGAKRYKDKKASLLVEIDAKKRDKAIAEKKKRSDEIELTSDEMTQIMKNLDFEEDPRLEIQAKVLEAFENPVNKNSFKNILDCMQTEQLKPAEVGFAHPEKPEKVIFRLIVVAKKVDFIQHLGKPEEVELCLYGHSYDAKAHEIFLQVRYQGEGLLPVCQIIKSCWLLENSNEIFLGAMLVKADEAYLANDLFRVNTTIQQANQIRELMILLDEKDYFTFNKQAEVFETCSKMIRLGKVNTIGKLNKDSRLSDRDRTIIIAITPILITIVVIFLIIWFGA